MPFTNYNSRVHVMCKGYLYPKERIPAISERAGLAVTVAHVVCAPSTAPPFAKLPSMATSQKIAAHCSQFSGRSLRFESC